MHLPKDDGPSSGGPQGIRRSLLGRLGDIQSDLGGASAAPMGSVYPFAGSWANGQAKKVPVRYGTVCLPGTYCGRTGPGGDVKSGSNPGDAGATDKERSTALIPGLDRLLSEVYPEECEHSYPIDKPAPKFRAKRGEQGGLHKAERIALLGSGASNRRLLTAIHFADRHFGQGVGAVLSQAKEEGDQPVAYFSKKLLPREERYSSIKKKCLAMKLAVQVFRVYVLGRPFVIQTDHRVLES